MSWEAEGSVQATLQAVAMSAVDTVPGADWAGVSLVEAPRKVTIPAASDEVVWSVDMLQSTLGEGPSLDALRREATVRVGDLRADQRWPTFGPRAADAGLRSLLGFRLFNRGDRWGTLNLYARSTDAFGEGAEVVGLLFASHAAIALTGAQEIAELNEALAARDLIGQAKGILVERHKITADEAFGMLVSRAQRTGTKLVEAAAQLVGGGSADYRGPLPG